MFGVLINNELKKDKMAVDHTTVGRNGANELYAVERVFLGLDL